MRDEAVKGVMNSKRVSWCVIVYGDHIAPIVHINLNSWFQRAYLFLFPSEHRHSSLVITDYYYCCILKVSTANSHLDI